RDLTAALELCEERAFRSRRRAGLRMIERLDCAERSVIIDACNNGKCPLACGGEPVRQTEHFADAILTSEPAQSRKGEDDAIAVTGIENVQARVEIAAQILDDEVGASGKEECTTSQGAGPDACAGRQIAQ